MAKSYAEFLKTFTDKLKANVSELEEEISVGDFGNARLCITELDNDLFTIREFLEAHEAETNVLNNPRLRHDLVEEPSYE